MLNLARAEQVLSPEFIPPELVAREKQLQALTEDTPRSKNYFIQGWTNTGKTATLVKAIEHFKQHHPEDSCFYVKCDRALMIPLRTAVERLVGSVTTRQNPIDELFERVLKKAPQTHRFRFYFDDAHMVAQFERTGSVKWTELVHKIYETAKTFNVKLQMVIVGTLPYIDFPRFLSGLHKDDQARGRFAPLVFDNYTMDEMKKIYEKRLDLIPASYDSEVVRWVVATVKANAGELPMGFDLLFEGVKKIVEEKRTKLQVEDARNVFPKIKVDYWTRQLEEMDEHSRLVLAAATEIALNRGRIATNISGGLEPAIFVNGHEIGVEYEKLCLARRFKPLYKQRQNYLLMRLCVQGFLSKEGRDERTFSTKYRYELNPSTLSHAMHAMELPTGHLKTVSSV